MATPPHSLPLHSQRIAAQLPFSPSPSSTYVPGQRRQPPGNRPHAGSISNISPHIRSGSGISSRSRHAPTSPGELPYTLPPIPIIHQPRPNSGPFSAQPASFFQLYRPSNPTTPPPPVPALPRPSSPGSMVSSEAHALNPVHLVPFRRQDTPGSDVSDSNHASTEDLHTIQLPPSSSKSPPMKHSREPLLPIGPRSSPHKPSYPSRPSLSIAGGPYGRSESSISPSGKMRDSFEKLFKRRSDSNRRSMTAGPSNMRSPTGSVSHSPYLSRSGQASPISPVATNGRMTFEVSDEDGVPLSPTTRYKASTSPAPDSSISIQDMSFNPIPPDVRPPLAQMPILSEKTGKPIRRYQVYPSRNRFFLDGLILTGGDSPWAFIASLTVVLGITGVWFGTTCVWWWLNESPAVAAVGAYMCLLTISSMLATAFRDPGILPRNLDPDPPFPAPTGSEDSLRAPLPRDLKVRAGIVRVKYCPTCRTYRPPRSSHCKMCDNCVDNCDHHCQWVNNCVGRRNYTSFFTFLFSAVLTLILVICTTAIHLWLLTTSRFGLSFKQALQTSQGVGSAVAFCMSIIVVWPVSALLTYHLRLLLLNVTTIEQIRNQAHKTLAGPPPPNPFSHGSWRRNLYYVLCRPAGYSWLDPRGIATEDKREINPGLLEDRWQTSMEEGRGIMGKGQ